MPLTGNLTCDAGEYLTDTDQHILRDLPPDGQVRGVVHNVPDGLVDGLLLHEVQPLAFQNPYNSQVAYEYLFINICNETEKPDPWDKMPVDDSEKSMKVNTR